MGNTQERIGATHALIELLKSSNDKVASSISGASLAYVKEILRDYEDGYGRASLTLVPQWDNDGTNLIEGYFFSDMQLKADQLVLTVFTDRDFRSVIDSQQDNGTTANQNTHSKNFGVIIKL